MRRPTTATSAKWLNRSTGTSRSTSSGQPRWARLLPLLAILSAVVVAALVINASQGSAGGARAGSSEAQSAPMPADAVRVSSDAPRFASLDELVGSTDLVVRARVVATERGRWFGEEASTSRVQSRLVTLEVDEVLIGELDAQTLVVEEEGWLADGAPLVVDGAAPSRVDDDGIWFLVDGGDPVLGAYVVVSAQGRYLVTDSAEPLVGAELDDPLVDRLAELTEPELAARLRTT